MRKIFLLLALLMVSAVSAFAQISLRVTHVDGSETTFVLDKQPEVALLAGKLHITTAQDEPVDFEIDDVESIDFLGKTGVDSAAADAVAGITVSVNGSMVTFGNIPDGSMVQIFNTAGTLVAAAKASGTHTISRSELASGVYIVKINNFVTKVSL